MQAPLAGLAKVALKYAHTCSRFAAPWVSEYWRAKVWLALDPESGVTETVDGVPGMNATVQAPNCCHPLLDPDISTARRYTFLAPSKAGLNATTTVSVKVFPLGETVAAATFTEHWLFCNVVADPIVAHVHTVPLSFSKLIWLLGAL